MRAEDKGRARTSSRLIERVVDEDLMAYGSQWTDARATSHAVSQCLGSQVPNTQVTHSLISRLQFPAWIFHCLCTIVRILYPATAECASRDRRADTHPPPD